MSYTPTTWQTGDTITAEKLNNMESGIADALPAETTGQSSKIGYALRLSEFSEDRQGYVLDRDLSYSTIFNITFDGSSFSQTMTNEEAVRFKHDVSNDYIPIGKLSDSDLFLIFRPVMGNGIIGYSDLQSGIFPLDNLGMTGYVGFFYMYYIGPNYGLELYSWQATAM